MELRLYDSKDDRKFTKLLKDLLSSSVDEVVNISFIKDFAIY